ncbi:MAG TPA: Ig-like domain-containing protein [Segetibacter sp.]|nr:Ig-like domain-containing protein [Segetibacter sp.]
MPPIKKWVCQTDKTHIFDDPTDDYFCPNDHTDGDIGLLIYEEIPIEDGEITVAIMSPSKSQKFEEGTSITITADADVDKGRISKVEFLDNEKRVGEVISSPYHYSFQATSVGAHSLTVKAWDDQDRSQVSKPVTITVTPTVTPEVGLCVILMDASASMFDPAFEGSPLTKARLVATSAANGIFDLERMQNNPYAYIALFKFDDRVELMLMETVDQLITRFEKNERQFANYLYDELSKMQQGTDINQALMQAYSFVDKFLKKQLPNFPLKKYRPMMQRILKYGSGESVSIPNIRVLIYTDGRQFAHGVKVLHPNPFSQSPLEGLNHDILIGAFFGNGDDEGCQELKDLVSRCPIHDELQFFLFDNPARISSLKYLFRMASGASGFCPKDLEKEIKRES